MFLWTSPLPASTEGSRGIAGSLLATANFILQEEPLQISSMTYAVWDLYRPKKKKKTLYSRSPVPLGTSSHRCSDKLLAWL